MPTPLEVSVSLHGDPFSFAAADADLADTLTFGGGNWGLYNADGNVTVTDTVSPRLDTDGVTSLAGVITFSVTLWHLTTFTHARVHFDADGGPGETFSLNYTLDGGTTYTTLDSNDGVVPLSPGDDFDIQVSFYGGLTPSTSVLRSLTVYIFKTDTTTTLKGYRKGHFGGNKITADGLVVGTPHFTVDAGVNPNPSLPSGNPGYTQSGSIDMNVFALEMWVNPTTTTIMTSPPTGTMWVNGVSGGTITAGVKQHVVIVLTTPANTSFSIGPNLTLSHLAFYPYAPTSVEIVDMYNLSSATTPSLVIHDTGSIGVTEYTTPVDIYAYTWSIVAGGTQ